jgi:murein DD-endopeptidase MepM/ murein hydrolase activator NlpD
VVVEFPLRGDWIAPNTPGHRVPSHGTDFGGQTYAYDFLQVDSRFPAKWRAWAQPIYAPFPGEVIEAEDGIRERNPAHMGRDLFIALKNGFSFKGARSNRDLRHILGNYVILKGKDAFALFAHARHGSIAIRRGETIATAQKLAEVGHSGNSTSPHLHFQLMDRPELLMAKGVPCSFRQYELFEDGAWKTVMNGIPRRTDRIRVLEAQ